MNRNLITVKFFEAVQLKYSAMGTPRWKFRGITDDGELLWFQTASTSSSAYRYNLNRVRAADILAVECHWTKGGKLIADHWRVGWDPDDEYWAELAREREAAKLNEAAMPAQANSRRRAI